MNQPEKSRRFRKNQFCCRLASLAKNNRTSLGHHSGKKRAGDPKLQSRRQTRPHHRMVQRWRVGEDIAHRQQVASRLAASRIALFPANDEQQKGARRGCLLVRGPKYGRNRHQQECHFTSSW